MAEDCLWHLLPRQNLLSASFAWAKHTTAASFDWRHDVTNTTLRSFRHIATIHICRFHFFFLQSFILAASEHGASEPPAAGEEKPEEEPEKPETEVSLQLQLILVNPSPNKIFVKTTDRSMPAQNKQV